jgi:uncharacterized protein (DUF2141 family)
MAMLGCGSPASLDTSASPSPVSPQSESSLDNPPLQVEVIITGFDGLQGKCRVAAYNSSKGFHDPEAAIAREVLSIDSDTVRWSFECPYPDDPSSPVQLAISAYQDRNDNALLDKNVIGIPTERYGFSNNPKRGYGPPKFEQAVLVRPKAESPNEPWSIPVSIQ